MSKTHRHTVLALIAALLQSPLTATHAAESPKAFSLSLAMGGKGSESDVLGSGFRNPPPSARPWVYWFWMGGNITKEGMTADLEAMARVGIGGVLIMNVQHGLTAPRPAVFMSPEWRALFAHGVGEAHRLGLQVCIHDCDGWSGSGGPWVTPENAMQQLVWMETRFHGPGRFAAELPLPTCALDYYRDIAVLAFPAPGDDLPADRTGQPEVTSNIPKFDGAKLIDGDRNSFVNLTPPQGGQPRYLQLDYPAPISARGFSIGHGPGTGVSGRAELQVSENGTAFHKLCDINLTGHQDAILRSTTVSFPEIRSRAFRLVFATLGERGPTRLAELRVLTGSRLNYWETKAGFHYYNEHGGGPRLFETLTSGGTADDLGPAPAAPAIPSTSTIRHDAVQDLTRQLDASGKFTWDAPAGDWVILRIGHTPNGRSNAPATKEGRGPACDKLGSGGLEALYAGMVSKLIKDVGPLAPGSFSGVEIDSWECGIQNWTAKFRAEFQRRRGYDLLSYLPVMLGGRIVDDLAVSERFLWDVRRTIADLMAENYYARMRQLCAADGMTFFVEAAGRQQFLYDPIVYQREGDLPMGEFWMGTPEPRVDCKVASSVAHVYGKPIAGAESFTSAAPSARWSNDPFRLKPLGDLAFCYGVNRFVFHRYAHQPWLNLLPGMTMGPWGIHFERTNTWWEQGRAWNEYLARCQFLLQQGLSVSDVCYFTGENVPNYLGRRQELHPPLPEGYDYDGCDANALLKLIAVDDRGYLVLPSGVRYRVLLLPEVPTITPPLFQKIRQLVQAGATVVGPKPQRSPSLAGYPGCDRQVQAMAEEVWGDCDGTKVKEHAFGKGRVVWGKPFEELLTTLGTPPDFQYGSTAGGSKLSYVHRRLGTMDLYFVANGQNETVDVQCSFRVRGKRPELWFPDVGRVERLAVFDQSGDCTRVPLRLDPFGSVFVVFRSEATGSHAVSIASAGVPLFPVAFSKPPVTMGDNNRQIVDSFTMAAWVKPGRDIRLPKEAAEGIAIENANFAVYPPPGHGLYGDGHAGAGLSVGRNGVCVLEHSARTIAPMLVYAAPLPEWIHLAVVYQDRQPKLYLNGKLVRSGLKSPRVVHSGVGVHSGRKAPAFAGEIRGLVQYARPLSAAEIVEIALSVPSVAAVRLPEMVEDARGRLQFTVWEPGAFDLRLANGQSRKLAVPLVPPPWDVPGPWDVRFPPGAGAPEKTAFAKLVSWTERPEKGIKYFSGTATYQTQFQWEPHATGDPPGIFLDLGIVKNLAEVKLNDRPLGILWKPPYLLEISGIVKRGVNALEIRVTNLWPNRLIGDEQLPDDCRWGREGQGGSQPLAEWPQWLLKGQPRTSGRQTFATWKHWQKDDSLLPSGLLGPVQLRSAVTKRIQD